MGLMLSEMQLDFLYEKPPYYKFHPEYAPSDELIKEYVLAYGEGKDMWIEVKRTLIATHYLWAVWSLAMYNGPTEGYNYLTYSMLRFNEFKNHYSEYIEQGGEATLLKISEELFS